MIEDSSGIQDINLVPMLLLISVVLIIILSAMGLKRLLPATRASATNRFVRETLANGGKSDDPRVIASLSTVPDRISNLWPTIRSLLKQTRPSVRLCWPFRNFRSRAATLYHAQI